MSSVTHDEIYQIDIRRGGYEVVANAGAKLSIQINNQWVNVLQALGFSGDGEGGMISNAINGFQIFSGNNFLPKIFTSHVWRGSNGLEFSLALRFDAWDDARQDVVAPMIKLVQMFMPTRGGDNAALSKIIAGIEVGDASGVASNLSALVGNQFLHPPGPTPWEMLTGQSANYLVNLRVGKVWTLTDLIPTSFSMEFEDRYTKDGDPVCATTTLGFQSFQTPDSNDVAGYFQANSPASALAAGVTAP